MNSPVIRHAQVRNEPMLLPAGMPALASPVVARPAATPARNEPPSAATLEAELRRKIDAETKAGRDQAWSQAHEAGYAEGVAKGRLEGHAAGLEEGLEAGRRQGRDDWADRIQRLDLLLSSLHKHLEAGIAGQDDLMVELAFEAAAKVVGEAAVSRDGLVAIVRQALQGLREREQLVIRLAPRDAEMLAPLRGELARLADTRSVEIEPDDRIELGGCLIETAGGGLDARLETQMQRLRDVLFAARGSGGSG